MPKIKTQDINGNWIYVDLDTRKVESAAPQQGTIQRNANREVRKARSAQRYKAQQKNKKQAEFAKQYNSHQETSSMVRTKQASPEEVDRGITDKYEIIPDHKVIGMSGADPVGQFAVEMAALDMPFRLAGKAAMYGLGRYGENLGVENLSRWARNRLVANEFRNSTPSLSGYSMELPAAQIRTRLGDVEIDNPYLAYRQGSKEMGEDFSRTGIVFTDGEFKNPMFAQGRLWYGVPTEKMLKQGKGIQFKTSNGRTINLFKRNEEAPKTDLLVSTAEMVPASQRSTPQNWITTFDGITQAQNWGGRRVPLTQATKDNTVRYIFKPGYGYKQVVEEEPTTSLKFFERPQSLEADGVPIESRMTSPQITEANAASLTPEQWTAAQDAAIARGDMAEAQRLRDLHFKTYAPNTQIKDIQYHGAKANAKFNVFDPERIGQTDQGWAGRGYYFTPSIDYAKMYGSKPRAFYINAQKVHDGTASAYFGRENSPAANAFKIIRKRYNDDGQQILDELASSDAIRTSFSQTKPYDGIFEEVVTRNNNQMKLADAVTYGDNGVRVPLGERDNFNINDIRYYESPNREAMKGVKYIEQTPSATSLDAEQQLEQRLKSYTPKVGENGLIEYKSLNSNDVINIPEEAVEKQIQRYIDSGMTREDAIEHLREQFGYGAMTQNGKTFLLPEKYMITNPEYMKAHDAIHRILRFDDSFNIPGAEGLNPNEAVAMISGEIKPALGIQANQPLTEEMLDKWLKTTDSKITGRYGFSSKIKDKKKFLEWVNKVAPTALPLLLGSSISTTSYKKQGGKMYKFNNKIKL